MPERCYRCFRPMVNCFCERITPVATGIKFVFLMHPKEAYRQKTGTGRLASLSLSDSEIIVGIDFSHNRRLNELISGQGEAEGHGEGRDYFPVLLYPDKEALYADSPALAKAASKRKLLVIVVDATWFFARKMVQASVNLHALPKLSFNAGYKSRFEFKRQPAPECLSTIESSYYLIQELRNAGIVDGAIDPEPLMRVFRDMVQYQLSKEQERHESMAACLYPELFDR